MRELPFAINWTFAHPRAIELADEIASLAPGDLNRSSSCRAAPRRSRPPGSSRASTTPPAASGAGRRSRGAWPTTAPPWARSRSTAAPSCARRSSRSCRTCCTCRTRTATTGRPRRPRRSSPLPARRARGDDPAGGARTVAMVIIEPVQNTGGSFMPPAGYLEGVREICDRHGILLCFDEVITGFGRARPLVRGRALRRHARPDHLARRGSPPPTRDRRARGERARDGAVPRRRPDVHARHDLRRPPGAGGGRAEEHRDHAPRANRRARARAARTTSAPRSSRCSSCRSWATCAAPASSTRSSS